MTARSLGAVRDWARIVLLPAWLTMNLIVHDVSTWRTVIETALVTLLVYTAVERRVIAHRQVPELPPAAIPKRPEP